MSRPAHAFRALMAPLVFAGGLLGCGGPKAHDPIEPPVDADSTATPPTRNVDAGVRAEPAPVVPPDARATTPSPAVDAAAPVASPDGGSGPTQSSSDAAPAVGEDEQPARPLKVDKASAQLFSFSFKPSEADPGASARDLTQLALLDTRVPELRGKLVIVLSGVGGAPGPTSLARYAASQGFHAFAVAYQNDYNPSTQSDPAFFGNARFEAFDGMDRTPRLTVSRPDCVEVRVAKALAYLQTKHAGGDWAYYLKADGQVRWSDVIFAGHSHGASSAAAYGKLRRLHRAISMAGPRDTNPVTATWLTMPSATPIDRFYGFTGTGDAQYPDHQKAMEAMGYVGKLVNVSQSAAPYGGSHRLAYPGGHGDAIDCGQFADACKYMFGIP